MAFEPVVVSATDGPLPETVDTLKTLQAQGATSVDVVIDNTGLVDDPEILELIEIEMRDLAAQHGLTVHSVTRGTYDPVDPDAPPVPYGPS